MHQAPTESHHGQFACEVAPARRRVSHPPQESANSHQEHQRPHDASAFIFHPQSRISPRAHQRRSHPKGRFSCFFLLCSRYISCIFFCVFTILFFLLTLSFFHLFLFPSCVTKKRRRHSDLSFSCFDGRTHYLNNEWHREGDDGGTKMERT